MGQERQHNRHIAVHHSPGRNLLVKRKHDNFKRNRQNDQHDHKEEVLPFKIISCKSIGYKGADHQGQHNSKHCQQQTVSKPDPVVMVSGKQQHIIGQGHICKVRIQVQPILKKEVARMKTGHKDSVYRQYDQDRKDRKKYDHQNCCHCIFLFLAFSDCIHCHIISPPS